MNERFKIDIPEGYRIFEREFPIAGSHHYKDEFLRIMKKGNVSFGMRLDPNNKHDPNAIKVVGSRKSIFGKTEKQIGYIPAEIASQISDAKVFDDLIMRPKAYYVSDKLYIEFKVDLLGPKEKHGRYTKV